MAASPSLSSYRESLARFVRQLNAEARAPPGGEPKAEAIGLGGPTMQSARKATSSSASFQDRVDGPRPMRVLLLGMVRAAALTNAALELHNRIEVWVNEGGAGGEAD